MAKISDKLCDLRLEFAEELLKLDGMTNNKNKLVLSRQTSFVRRVKNLGLELFRPNLYSSALSVVPLTMHIETSGWDLYIDSNSR